MERNPIGLRFARRSRGEEKKASRVEYRREEDQQNQIRRQLDIGHNGNNRQSESPKDEENRVGYPEEVGEHHQPGHGREQPEDPKLQMSRQSHYISEILIIRKRATLAKRKIPEGTLASTPHLAGTKRCLLWLEV